jgi:hypothetical protein
MIHGQQNVKQKSKFVEVEFYKLYLVTVVQVWDEN